MKNDPGFAISLREIADRKNRDSASVRAPKLVEVAKELMRSEAGEGKYKIIFDYRNMPDLFNQQDRSLDQLVDKFMSLLTDSGLRVKYHNADQDIRMDHDYIEVDWMARK